MNMDFDRPLTFEERQIIEMARRAATYWRTTADSTVPSRQASCRENADVLDGLIEMVQMKLHRPYVVRSSND